MGGGGGGAEADFQKHQKKHLHFPCVFLPPRRFRVEKRERESRSRFLFFALFWWEGTGKYASPNKKGILSLICGVENSIFDKSFWLFTPLLRQSFYLFTPLLRQSFCLFTVPLLRQSFCLFTPQKTIHGRLKNCPPNNNKKKKKNNAFLSLICRLRRR